MGVIVRVITTRFAAFTVSGVALTVMASGSLSLIWWNSGNIREGCAHNHLALGSLAGRPAGVQWPLHHQHHPDPALWALCRLRHAEALGRVKDLRTETRLDVIHRSIEGIHQPCEPTTFAKVIEKNLREWEMYHAHIAWEQMAVE